MSDPTQPAGYPPPPPYATAPAPESRPNTLGLTALILAIIGLVISLGGFVPMAWISLVLAAVGGLLLLAALVVGIVAAASSRQGGKGLGIAAIVVSVVGGVLWAFAIVAAVVWIGLAAADTEGTSPPTPAVTATVEPGETDTDADGAASAQEQAYLDEVKPAVLAIMQTIEPSITAEQLDQFYSDDDLIASGEQLASIPADQRDAQRQAFITAGVESSGGILTEETAGQLFDVLIGAADRHLVN